MAACMLPAHAGVDGSCTCVASSKTPAARCACHAVLQSKKRGLSLEEKRDKVLEVFHASGDVFVLKVSHAVCCLVPRLAAAAAAGMMIPMLLSRALLKGADSTVKPSSNTTTAAPAAVSTGATLLPIHRQDVEKLASKKGVVLQSIKEVLQSLVDDDLVHAEKIGASNYFWCEHLLSCSACPVHVMNSHIGTPALPHHTHAPSSSHPCTFLITPMTRPPCAHCCAALAPRSFPAEASTKVTHDTSDTRSGMLATVHLLTANVHGAHAAHARSLTRLLQHT